MKLRKFLVKLDQALRRPVAVPRLPKAAVFPDSQVSSADEFVRSTPGLNDVLIGKPTQRICIHKQITIPLESLVTLGIRDVSSFAGEHVEKSWNYGTRRFS